MVAIIQDKLTPTAGLRILLVLGLYRPLAPTAPRPDVGRLFVYDKRSALHLQIWS